MEALAAGVPVVTRDLPVLREVFGQAAWFADCPRGFAEQLAEALRGDAVRRARGERMAARHTWGAAAAAQLRLYRQLTTGETSR